MPKDREYYLKQNEKRRTRYKNDEEYRNKVRAASKATAEKIKGDPEKHKEANKKRQRYDRLKSALKSNGLTNKEDFMYNNQGRDTLGLEGPASNVYDDTDTDTIYDEEQREYVLKAAMKKYLDHREEDILKHLYGLFNEKQLSMEELSDLWGVSREKIRQIREIAIRKLRAEASDKIIKMLSESINKSRRIKITECQLCNLIMEAILGYNK